jgi:hypothetical protein
VVLSAGWTITASRVFSDPSVTRWLCFAGGAAVWTLGGLGLVAHERLLEGRMRRLIEEERYRLAMTRSPAGTDERLHRAGRP